jgi:alpha-tubulin suppressor-like RCC1 family protein
MRVRSPPRAFMSLRRILRAAPLLAGLAVACSDGPLIGDSDAATINTNVAEVQFGVVGTPVTILPSVVVRDESGVPVSGVMISFVASSGGGTVTGAQAVTDANGIATVGGWTLGPNAIENRLTASAPGTAVVGAIFRANALAPGFDLDSVVAGQSHSCGINTAGSAFCWGSNTVGALGDGTFTSRARPVVVSGGLSFKSITAGFHTCALTSAGAAWCWGSNTDGQLGDGTTLNRNTPRLVTGAVAFQSITAGDSHTCGLSTAGRAFCWGDNSKGQLGDGTFNDRTNPVAVAGNLTFRSLSPSGGAHTCGVTTTNIAYCWGDNTGGVLGDGTSVNRPSPVPVVTGVSLQLISSHTHTCALTAAGAAHCWGSNAQGQLGDGTTTGRTTPAPVSGGHVFGNIDAGLRYTCGVTAGGIGRCWGLNDRGQIGDGTLNNRLVPTIAAPGLIFTRIAAGDHTCGVTRDYGVYCWGDNTEGALGNGSVFSSATPVAVLQP